MTEHNEADGIYRARLEAPVSEVAFQSTDAKKRLAEKLLAIAGWLRS